MRSRVARLSSPVCVRICNVDQVHHSCRLYCHPTDPETVCSWTVITSVTLRICFRPSWGNYDVETSAGQVWCIQCRRACKQRISFLRDDLAATGVDLIQIVSPLSGFSAHVVYRSSLILHPPRWHHSVFSSQEKTTHLLAHTSVSVITSLLAFSFLNPAWTSHIL